MGHDGKPLGLGLGQAGVGGDDGDRGVLGRAGLRLVADLAGVGGKGRGQPQAAELVADLEGRRPEVGGVADRRLADRVDGDERRDGDAARQTRRSRAEPALHIGGRRAGAGADRAEGERLGRGGKRGAAEAAVGGSLPQSLSPPLRRSKRIAAGTIGTRAAPTAKPRPASASAAMTPPPASSPKAEPPERTMASTRSTVCSGASRSVSRRARRAAHDMDRGDRRLLAEDHRHAGFQRGVLGVADAEAGDVGEEVGRRRHGYIFRASYLPLCQT